MGMTTIIVPTTSKRDPVMFIWPPGCQRVYTRAGLGVGRAISTVIGKRCATRRELCNSPVRLRRPDVESDFRKTLVPLIRSGGLHRLQRGSAHNSAKNS